MEKYENNIQPDEEEEILLSIRKANKKSRNVPIIIAIVVIALLLIGIGVFAFIKFGDKLGAGSCAGSAPQGGEATPGSDISHDKDKDTYTGAGGAIEVINEEGLCFDVNTSQYTLPVTVFNKKNQNYSSVTITLEFYDDKHQVIKQVPNVVENLLGREERKVVLPCGQSEILIYDYKVVNIEAVK